MSYIGNPIISTDFPKDTFSGNGSTTAFTMSIAPASVNAVIVVVSGITQDPSTYTISGTTLTFSGAPPSGTNNISVRHLGIAGIPNTPSAGSVVTASIADSNVTTAKIADANITPAKLSTGAPSWDSSGRVLTPNQPAFYGYRTAGNVTGNATVVHNYVVTNIGSYYNSTTGIFTCPVAGVYEIMVGGHAENSQPIVLQIHKNGSMIAEEYSNGAAYAAITLPAIVSCAASDQLSHVVNLGTFWGGNQSGLRMTIKLIG